MSELSIAGTKGMMRIPKITLEVVLYLLPISLMVGTNFPAFSVGDRTIYIGTTEIIIGVLLIGVFCRFVLGKTNLPVRKDVFLIWFAAVLFSIVLPLSVLSRIFEAEEPEFIKFYIEMLRWLEGLLVFLVMGALIKEEKQVKNLLAILFIGALANVAAGLFQAATFDFWEQRIYGLFVSGANRENTSVSNPNVIGALYMCASLFIAPFAINTGTRRRTIFLVMLVPTVLALFFSMSRSAVLGFLVGALTLICLYGVRPKHIAALTVLSALTFFALLLSSDFFAMRMENFFHIAGDSVEAQASAVRLSTWLETMSIIPDHLLLGVGFGGYEKYFGELTPDNYYIEILATTGAVGLIALAWMFFTIFNGVTRFRPERNTFSFAFKVAYLSSFISLLTASFFSGLFFNPRLLGLFWLLTGLIIQYKRLHGMAQARLNQYGR